MMNDDHDGDDDADDDDDDDADDDADADDGADDDNAGHDDDAGDAGVIMLVMLMMAMLMMMHLELGHEGPPVQRACHPYRLAASAKASGSPGLQEIPRDCPPS